MTLFYINCDFNDDIFCLTIIGYETITNRPALNITGTINTYVYV